MKYKILLCSVVMFFSSVFSTSVWGEISRPDKEEEETEADYTEDSEIDNFDFLYADEDFSMASAHTANEIMDEAFSHLGTRYRYGSTGPSSFDCSGFTSYVFRQNDFSIGRTSRDQFAKNEPIQRDELQRGDLVFFTSPRSGRGVGHVGIVVDVNYLTGTFTFIHASTKEGVKVSKSTDGYYARRYVGARRVLQ